MTNTEPTPLALALRSAVGAFLARFDAFCVATGRSEGGVSDAIFGSSRKVKDLRAGSGVGVYTLADAETALARLAAEASITLPEPSGAQNSFPAQGAGTDAASADGERLTKPAA